MPEKAPRRRWFTRKAKDQSIQPDSLGSSSEGLGEEEVAQRIRAVGRELAARGVVDFSDIPMSRLTEEEEAARMAEIQRILGLVPHDDGERELTPGELQAVARQLDMLDYMLDFPDTSVSPYDSLDTTGPSDEDWGREFFQDGA